MLDNVEAVVVIVVKVVRVVNSVVLDLINGFEIKSNLKRSCCK